MECEVVSRRSSDGDECEGFLCSLHVFSNPILAACRPAPLETRAEFTAALQYWKSKARSVRPALIVWGVEDGRGPG